MLIYNLNEYSLNYSKQSGKLSQYCRGAPNATLAGSESLKSKIKKVKKKFLIRKMFIRKWASKTPKP